MHRYAAAGHQLIKVHGGKTTVRTLFFNSKTKSKPKWEAKSATSSNHDALTRKLKEELNKPFNGKSNSVKSLVLEICQQGKVDGASIPLITRALSSEPKIKQYEMGELQQIFQSVALCAGDQSQNSPVTRLYSILYSKNNGISQQEQQRNGIIYLQYLRRKGMLSQSRKLSLALLQEHGYPSTLLQALIETVSQISPEEQSVYEILGSIPAWANVDPEVIKEGLLLYTKVCSESGTSSGEQKQRINQVMDALLFRHNGEITQDVVIVALDSCLSLEAVEAGRRVLDNLVRPLLGMSMLQGDIENGVENMAPESHPPTQSTMEFHELILLCVTRFGGDEEMGRWLVGQIQSSSEPLVKETWDALVQWQAYSSSDIDMCINVLNQMDMQPNIEPDEETLQGIIAVSYGVGTRQDSYVDAIIAHFKEQYQVDCDNASYCILMNRRVHCKDAEGALRLFNQSINDGCQWSGDEDRQIETLSALLVAMCEMRPVNVDQVFDTYAQIYGYSEKPLLRAAQTALLRIMVQLINRKEDAGQIQQYIEQQFGCLRGEHVPPPAIGLPFDQNTDLVQIMMDKVMTCPDYRVAWEIYGMLNQLVRLPFDTYLPCMRRFCQLGRPDAALLIFKYVRARSRTGQIPAPNTDMYVYLFDEFAHQMYEEGVNDLLTEFRTDLCMEADMQVMNAILRAQTELDDPDGAYSTFDEIANFPAGTGADNDTITTMLRLLTRTSLSHVEKFWVEAPKLYGVAPNEDNLRQYVIANCYHGYYLRALEMTKNMKQVYGIEPSDQIIEALYNWTMLAPRKEKVKQWAIQAYPETWKLLEASNRLEQKVIRANDDNDSEGALRLEVAEELEAKGQKQVM